MKKPTAKKPERESTPTPKLSDEERHARFVSTAKQCEADERSQAFDAAFDRVVIRPQKRDAT